MTFEEMVVRVRKALGVSSSYDDEDIPLLIRGAENRLLRDYHFPKSVQREEFLNLFLNSQEFTLPVGFKKELRVGFHDPVGMTWSDPGLEKAIGFQLPYPDDGPRRYWLEGIKLWIDTPLPSSMVGYTLQIWYENMDAETNEPWLLVDFPDSVFYRSVINGAPQFRKSEVLEAFTPLWQDEMTSLAIYLNELEWNNVAVNMREARPTPIERYPA